MSNILSFLSEEDQQINIHVQFVITYHLGTLVSPPSTQTSNLPSAPLPHDSEQKHLIRNKRNALRSRIMTGVIRPFCLYSIAIVDSETACCYKGFYARNP